MLNIGVIGLGFMGRMHLGAYRNIPRAKLVAISDQDPKRAAGDFTGGWGNMEGGVEKLDMSNIHGSTDWRELIALDAVQMVDICLPTPSHREVALAALAAGKHVLCEKPLALTSEESRQIADAAGRARGLFMPAMCLRFWPQWAWLKQANDQQTYGPMRGLRIIRIGGPPAGWFRDGAMSGGAILDLHIHDTDFICHLFGPPDAVFSRGYSQYSGKADHVITQYLYDAPSVPPLIVAEGGWLGEGFGFSMQYVANFRDATVDYDSRRSDSLLVTTGGKTEPVKLEGDGYTAELAYFIDCIENRREPKIVTASDAVTSIRVVEAEQRSIDSGEVVRFA